MRGTITLRGVIGLTIGGMLVAFNRCDNILSKMNDTSLDYPRLTRGDETSVWLLALLIFVLLVVEEWARYFLWVKNGGDLDSEDAPFPMQATLLVIVMAIFMFGIAPETIF